MLQLAASKRLLGDGLRQLSRVGRLQRRSFAEQRPQESGSKPTGGSSSSSGGAPNVPLLLGTAAGVGLTGYLVYNSFFAKNEVRPEVKVRCTRFSRDLAGFG